MEHDDIISFTVHGEPQGKGRPRFVSCGKYNRAVTPDQTVIYENLIKAEYTIKNGHRRFEKDIPLMICIKAYYKIPKSASKKKTEQMLSGDVFPIKKPDFDNVGKVIADALNGIAYYDDAQIVEAVVSKRYSDRPRVEVQIMQL